MRSIVTFTIPARRRLASVKQPSRRALLTGLVLSPLTGCATRPGLTSTVAAPTPSPSVTPTPDSDVLAAFTIEAELAGWLTGLVDAPTAWGATDALITLLRGYAAAHRTHATWLLDSEPIPTLPVDVTTPADMRTALSERETHAATEHARRSENQQTGWLSMVYASMSASARALAARGPAPVAVTQAPTETTIPTAHEAFSTLIGHIDRLNYVLEAGIGRLGDDTMRTPARTRLDDVKYLRDSVAGTLRTAGGKPPAIAVSYELPGPIDTPAQIQQAIGECESNVLDAWILVVGATTGDDRRLALQAMGAQAIEPGKVGYPITHWPGWQLRP